jgi:hypothetical protein
MPPQHVYTPLDISLIATVIRAVAAAAAPMPARYDAPRAARFGMPSAAADDTPI